MKIYLANFFSKKSQVADFAAELKYLGHVVTARWFNESVPHTVTMQDLPDQYHTETAIADIQDIDAADVLVLFSGDEHDYSTIPAASLARGGRHVELGYALGIGKEVIVCGQRENIFHHLPQIKHFATWPEVKTYLCSK